MYIHQVRTIVNRRNEELQTEILRKAEMWDCTVREVTAKDPFLAGKAFALGMLTLELIALEDELASR